MHLSEPEEVSVVKPQTVTNIFVGTLPFPKGYKCLPSSLAELHQICTVLYTGAAFTISSRWKQVVGYLGGTG